MKEDSCLNSMRKEDGIRKAILKTQRISSEVLVRRRRLRYGRGGKRSRCRKTSTEVAEGWGVKLEGKEVGTRRVNAPI